MGLDLTQCEEVYEALLSMLDRNGFGHLADRIRDAHSRPVLAEELPPPASAPPPGRQRKSLDPERAGTPREKASPARSVFAAPVPNARQKLHDIIDAVRAATSGAVALAAVATGIERSNQSPVTEISFVEPVEGREVQRVDRDVVTRWRIVSEGLEGTLAELSARIDAQ